MEGKALLRFRLILSWFGFRSSWSSQTLSFHTSTLKRAQVRKVLFPRSGRCGPARFTGLLSSRSGSMSHPSPPSSPAALGRKSADLHLCSSPSPPPVIPLPKARSCVLPIGCSRPLQEPGSSNWVCWSAPASPALPLSHTLPFPFFMSLSSPQTSISFVRSLWNSLDLSRWKLCSLCLSCFLHHHLMAGEKTALGPDELCRTGVTGAALHRGTRGTPCAVLYPWMYSRDQ